MMQCAILAAHSAKVLLEEVSQWRSEGPEIFP